MARVIVAFGSNLGDRLANLQAAIERMKACGVTVARLSSVWETESVPAGQPDYLNAAAVGETALSPLDLLACLKGIEHDLGRRPGERWAPRPIDLDILFYDDLSLAGETLTIPHPRIAERAFVLAPLAEVTEGPLPVLGLPATDLLAKLDTASARRTHLSLTTDH